VSKVFTKRTCDRKFFHRVV